MPLPPSPGAYTRPPFSLTRAVSDTKYTLNIPQHPFMPPDTSCTPTKQYLKESPIPQKVFSLIRKVDECKPLPVARRSLSTPTRGHGLPLRSAVRRELHTDPGL